MKYTSEIVIEKSVQEISSLLQEPENLHSWMEGLQSVDLLDGDAGKKGAKSKLVFLHGKKTTEMIETILELNLPKRMVKTYDSKGINSIIFITLQPIEINKTKYIATQEFKLHGFMKVVGFLAPSMFKKQTQKTLNSFKNFAESN
ncbi:MAG: SRPBCC family protein [Flavobacteriales bacterium]